MVLQKLKLHEWFLTYQLDHIKWHNHHLPTQVPLDITGYAHFYQQRNQKMPLNALILKLIGQWAFVNPNAHKMLFRTWGGWKFLFGDEIRINMPIEIKHQGQSVITAIVIRNPQDKSIEEISLEIKKAKSKLIDSFPITKFAYLKPNVFYNRWLLMGIHKLINSCPTFYWNKGGGCLSVSSLSNMALPNMAFSIFSFGPTGFTFFYKDIIQSNGKTYLNLSIGVDHNCYTGVEIISLVNRLMSSVQIEEQKILSDITQDGHI